MFNNPESACRTCGGIGTHKLTHPDLLIPDPARSIIGGCFVREAFKYNVDTWDGRMMYSLAKAKDSRSINHGRIFPSRRRTPSLTASRVARCDSLLRPRRRSSATMGRQRGRLRRNRAAHRAPLPHATASEARRIREWKLGWTKSWSSTRVPTATAPACARRVCCSRSTERRIYDFGQLNFDELHAFLATIKPTGRGAEAGRQIVNEIRGRLDLLLGIGLDYLNFNRRSARFPAANRSASGFRRRSAPD